MQSRALRTAVADKAVSTLFAAGLAIGFVLVAPFVPIAAKAGPAIATESYAQAQHDEKKEAPAARPAQPKRATPQRSAPRPSAPRQAAPQRSAPRQAAPQRAVPRQAARQRSAPRQAAPQRSAPRVAKSARTTPRSVTRPKATSRAARPAATRRANKQPNAAPASAARKAASPAAAARVVTPRGTRAVTASRLRAAPARGAGRTVIQGRNYSVWRSGYRVRHGSAWRTFVALSTLGAIAIGSSEYYPYAYISAPEPYCEGLTEDGCELQWQEVQTIEGDVMDQCVAYCPWR